MRKRLVVFGPVEGDHLNRWLPPFREEYDLHVVTLHSAPKDELAGVTYHNLARPTGSRLDFFLLVGKVRELFRKLKPDLLHVHYLSSYGVAASLTPKICPRVITLWGTDVNKGLKTPGLAALCRRALREFDFVNAPSQDLARKVAAVGVPRDRIAVFQYGVKTERLPLREPFPFAGRLKLVSFRDWAPLYRIEEIIRMVSEYTRTRDDLELHVMGRSTPEQKERIQTLVAAAPRPDLIHLHGFLSLERLNELLTEMHAMISIPTMDGMPLTLLESNYIGHAPLLSRIPANEEWAGPDGAIFLDDFEAASFDRAIAEARAFAADRARIERNRERVLAEGDYSRNMRRMGEIYAQLLQGGK